MTEEKWTVYSKAEDTSMPLAVEAYWEEASAAEAGMELEQYLSALDGSKYCVYSSIWPDGLQRIVLEEADTFFAGDKTAREVADMIQKRVDLYLKE